MDLAEELTTEEYAYTEEDYYSLPEHVRAELINGDLIYNQAAPSRIHQEILMELAGTIREYIKKNNGACRVYPAPFAVKLAKVKNTIVEPDISVIRDPDKLTDRGCTGAPDWVIEIISPSTARRDYVTKLNLYAGAGVREYWIIDPVDDRILTYDFEQEESSVQIHSHTLQDTVPSSIYPDLAIDFSKLEIS